MRGRGLCLCAKASARRRIRGIELTECDMIDYIKGELTELTPAKAVVEAAGVGYELNISLSTYSLIEGKQQAKLYAYEDIREDAWVLFGFASKQERELFLLLISVSGVGGNTARTILSSYSAQELCAIIAEKNDALLKRIKGIGAKTAQRIIVELADKVEKTALPSLPGAGEDSASAAVARDGGITQQGQEAIAALQMLGFSPAPTKKAVKQLLEQDSTLTAEAIIKQALKMI